MPVADFEDLDFASQLSAEHSSRRTWINSKPWMLAVVHLALWSFNECEAVALQQAAAGGREQRRWRLWCVVIIICTSV